MQTGELNSELPFTNRKKVPVEPAKLKVTLFQAFSNNTLRLVMEPETGRTVASPLPVIFSALVELNVTPDPSVLTKPFKVVPDCVPVEWTPVAAPNDPVLREKPSMTTVACAGEASATEAQQAATKYLRFIEQLQMSDEPLAAHED